jgi:hypothetical protein
MILKQLKMIFNMDRIYHTWDKWECYKAGFFEPNAPSGMSDEDCESLYAVLLKDIDEFKRIMLLIIDEWPNSCEHNLTNERMNRIAWMGQSALCYKYRIPARYRGGYNLLTEQEQQSADQAALDVINAWMERNSYPAHSAIEIKSKTEVDLY